MPGRNLPKQELIFKSIFKGSTVKAVLFLSAILFKTAIFLPRSLHYPLLSIDLFDGCRSFLKNKSENIELLVRNCGFGIDEKTIYAEIEKSLLEDQVDVVVAFLDSRYTELLHPLFEATGKILILVNMGTHTPVKVSARSTVIDHNFQISLIAWLTGALAGKDKNCGGLLVTSYYDAGYPHCFSVADGYKREKGNILRTTVINPGNGLYNPNDVKGKLEEDPSIDALLCLLSSEGAKMLYPILSEIQEKKKIGIYVSPMMIEKGIRPNCGNSVNYLFAKGYTSWSPYIENEANLTFQNIFMKETGRNPGIFSMLGWETGLLLQHIYTSTLQGGLNNFEIMADLKTKMMETPRGPLLVHGSTNQTYTPVYELEIEEGSTVKIKSVLSVTGELLDTYNSIKPDGISSGWKNTYPCY